MELRILGPVELCADGKRISAGHVKQQCVLAVLLLDLGRVVPVELLIDRVWGDSPPASVRNNLYAYLARLRAVIAGAGAQDVAICRRPGGYLLEADPDRVDLYQFRDRVTRASAAADGPAAGLLTEALALWRGPALAGLNSPWLTGMRDTLELERVAALLDLGDIALRQGEHVALASKIASEAVTHPADERLIGQLMLALCRSGRQAEALRWYERTRRHLADELGADPGPALTGLHRQILCGDPAIGAPAASSGSDPSAGGSAPLPRELPADIAAFTGRSAELATLDRLLDSTASEPTAVVISAVSGTAGVGKTALAVHWAHLVSDRFPDGQLYVNLRGYDPREPMTAAQALAGFLRALGAPDVDIPSDVVERAARYRSLLAGRRALVILDNASEAEQVRPLLPGAPTCVAVVTSRDSLPGLVARDGALRLELDLLPLAEAVDLLRALIGARVETEPAAAIALAGRCARLPLALRIAAELVVARPAAHLGDLVSELADQQRRLDLLQAAGDVRTEVRGVFSWSYRHLTAVAAGAFRLCGLHPAADFDAYAAAALLGITVDQARRQLGELAHAHLIQPGRADWFNMHDLLRAYAAEIARQQDTEQVRRDALTRLFDHYLHTASAAMNTLFPAERQVRPAVPAAASATPSVSEPESAQAWLDAHRDILVAVAARMTSGWPGQADRLVATVFRYLETGGFYQQLAAGYQHAYRDARQRGDLRGESQALTGLATADWRLGRYAGAEEHLRRALDLCGQAGDLPGEARALGTLGNVVSRQGRYKEAVNCYQQALSIYRQTGHLVNQASALGNLGSIELLQGRYDRAASYHQQALDLIRQDGNQIFESFALVCLGEVDIARGRHDQATSWLTQCLDLSRQTGHRGCEAHAISLLGTLDLKLGRDQLAGDHQRQALSLFRETGDRSGEAIALKRLGDVLFATGQLADARDTYDSALGLARQLGVRHEQADSHAGLARVSQATADLARARAHWQEALAIYSELGAPEADEARAELATATPEVGAPGGNSKPAG